MSLPIVQELANLLEGDRLRQEEIHTARKSLRLISAASKTSEGNDQGRMPLSTILADAATLVLDVSYGARGFEAVHDRHRNICRRTISLVPASWRARFQTLLTHEYNVVTIAVRFRSLNSQLPIFGGIHFLILPFLHASL